MAVKTARINTVSFSYSNIAKNWLVVKQGDILTLVEWAGGQMYVDLATPESLIWGICDDSKIFPEENETKEQFRVNYTPIAWDNTYKMEVSGEWTPKVWFFYTMTADQKIDLATESQSVGQFMVQDINENYIEVRFVTNQGLHVPQYQDVRLESIREKNPESDPFDGLYIFTLSNGTEIEWDFSALAWYLWDVTITGSLTVNQNSKVLGNSEVDWNSTIWGTQEVTWKQTVNWGLEVTGETSIDWATSITWNTSVEWNFSATWTAEIWGATTIWWNTDITGNISATGTADIGWATSIGWDTTIDWNISATWDATIGWNTSITWDATIWGDATVSGKVLATWDVQTQADLKSWADLHVGWDATIAWDTRIEWNSTLVGRTQIGWNTTIQGTLWVGSSAQFNAGVDIDQDLNVDGSAYVGGSQEVNWVLTVNGALVLWQNAEASQFILQTEKNVANWVAALDANGKISNDVIPPLAIGQTFVVDSEAAMLALTAQTGDVCVRTDISKTYIKLNDTVPSTMSDWQVFYTSGEVISVNGQTGAVVIDADDISDATTTNKFVTAAEKATWNAKQNAIGYTPENQALKDSLTLVNDPTHYPASTLVATLLDQKQNKINYTPENEANKETSSITDSTTKYPSSHAVLYALQAKESTANKDTATLVDSTTHYPSSHVLVDELAKKQAKLENQVNIKSINNISLLWSGNLDIKVDINFYFEITPQWATTYTLGHTPVSDTSFLVFTDSGTALFPTSDYSYANGVITFANLWSAESAVIWLLSNE